ncbi:hypothetical protein [Halomonas faecis]|uniref:hypothetical protein n=1 Tax=Halomonas faecis TaxID=1562110 RepID=UPI0013D5BFDF|nr:hypothetical protein [Halomonas faecis]
MRPLITGLLMATALPALADGTATMESGSGQNHAVVEVSWAGDDLRMDFPDQSQAGFMLLKDGKGYMVSDMQGQTVIMEMAKLREMAEGMAGDAGAETPMADEQASEVNSLEATGETETVAGVEGELYRMSWTDKAGNRHDNELVLSDDARVRELSAGFDAYQQSMTGEADAVAAALAERELGLLRFGDRFRLTSLSGESPDTARFELPEDAQTFEDMMGSALSQ